MDRIRNLSFLSRVGLCMVISLALNAIIGQYLKSSLSKGSFTVTVDAVYGADATMELMYDTGKDFNQRQRVPRPWKKGQDTARFPFELKEGEQLRYIRLDFGTNTDLKKVEINSMTLASEGKTLFRLKKDEISERIGLLTGISEVDAATTAFTLDTDRKPFDPYIVFDAVNELIFPNWPRTLTLVLPWLMLLFLPLLKWLKDLVREGEYVLIFVGLFCAAIPLKIAWVTFTTLLWVAYALFNYYKKRRIKCDPVYGAMLLFFLVPLLFLGNGEVNQLGIPIGFLLFVIVGSLIDFSDKTDSVKKIYSAIFLVVASITVVSWLLLMLYYGYYYKIDLPGYFMDIKTHAHSTMFWLYYPHTTFLSFFIVIGGIFCFDLYEKKEIGRSYGLLYGVFGFCTLLLLGSRFAVLMGISLPILVRFSSKKLGRWLVPAWAIIAALVVYFIGDIDFRRNQLWHISWAAFKERPWLGHGTGSSGTLLNDLERVRSAGFDTLLEMNHPHNQFLTYLLENGLLGTLLFFGAFLYIVYRFSKRRNKTMLLVCFMVLLLMITESPFRTTTPLYVIGFLFSIFASEQKPVASNLNK